MREPFEETCIRWIEDEEREREDADGDQGGQLDPFDPNALFKAVDKLLNLVFGRHESGMEFKLFQAAVQCAAADTQPLRRRGTIALALFKGAHDEPMFGLV